MMINDNKEDVAMDWGFLAGHKPKENDAIEPLTGAYIAVINRLAPGVNRNDQSAQIEAEFQVVEVLDGDGNPGRKLWKRYPETEKGMTSLVNDLFTAGIEVDRKGGEEAFKASLDRAVGKNVHVKARAWTPTVNRDGSEIPEDEQKPIQLFNVISEKRLAKMKAKAGAVKF